MNQEILNKKTEQVNEVVELLKAHDAMIIAEYRGLNVASLTDLRRQLKEKDSSLSVYKNTTVKRALATLNLEGLDSYLEGPNAVIFSKEVAGGGASVVTKFARKNEELVIKGGLFESKAYNKDEVIAISKLPNKDGLVSMFLSVLQAPIRMFACSVKAVSEKQ